MRRFHFRANEGTGECTLSKTDVTEDESLMSGAPSDSASTSRLSRVDIWGSLSSASSPSLVSSSYFSRIMLNAFTLPILLKSMLAKFI